MESFKASLATTGAYCGVPSGDRFAWSFVGDGTGGSFAMHGWFMGCELSMFTVVTRAPTLESDLAEAVCFRLRVGSQFVPASGLCFLPVEGREEELSNSGSDCDPVPKDGVSESGR